ncbi:MAG TPA: hypothetical protein VFB53_02505 [Burkholderiales bacterium]|jgi:hypothetical protein|nr:hypothetical protein [Burkholderiales bacterium]
MELTLERYLQDEGLREELERRAHCERAEAMHRFFEQSTRALNLQRTPALRTDACG